MQIVVYGRWPVSSFTTFNGRLKGYLVAELLKIRCPLVFFAKNQIRTKEGTKNHRLPNKKLRVFEIKSWLVARELTFINIIIKKNNELL